ncbi:choline kinase [Kribbella steppae]|uniref:Choline kinase n=1 Tax=Kribbella steppae TaxID=2512223 RepID=A0A4R2GYM7_9ACTN|nr:NTP transferase domain-containing protein [Kribbella steppae]TCO15696.1 choline kinase [Kribbella steppae]
MATGTDRGRGLSKIAHDETPGPAAVILAAGLGSRLRPWTDDLPKCLVEVSGQPILLRALRLLGSLGIERCICVVGYRGAQVRLALEQSCSSQRVTVVDAPEFRRTGTAASLARGLAVIPDGVDVLVMEGDVVFEAVVLQRLFAAPPSVTAVASDVPGCNGTFFGVANSDRVVTVHPGIAGRRGFGDVLTKAVNLHLISAEDLRTQVRPQLHRLLDRAPGAHIEALIGNWIGAGGCLSAVEVGDLRWWEIDDAHDLGIARRLFATGHVADGVCEAPLHGET